MDLEFKGVLYVGEELQDKNTWNVLPADLKSLYEDVNGIVAFQGGFHIRGCVLEPSWHSLHHYWKGPQALHNFFPALREADIPFAQDCLGDQFLLRLGTVWHLMIETGELDDLELELFDFLDEVIKDPIEFLALEPLLVFLDEGNKLEPGMLLKAEPPFSVEAPQYKMHKINADEIFRSSQK